MALFELKDSQLQELKSEIAAVAKSVNDLSENVGKWQGAQTVAVQAGLAGLIAAITGADVAEVQQRINTLAAAVKTEADALEQSTKSTEGE